MQDAECRSSIPCLNTRSKSQTRHVLCMERFTVKVASKTHINRIYQHVGVSPYIPTTLAESQYFCESFSMCCFFPHLGWLSQALWKAAVVAATAPKSHKVAAASLFQWGKGNILLIVAKKILTCKLHQMMYVLYFTYLNICCWCMLRTRFLATFLKNRGHIQPHVAGRSGVLPRPHVVHCGTTCL